MGEFHHIVGVLMSFQIKINNPYRMYRRTQMSITRKLSSNPRSIFLLILFLQNT